MNVILCFLTQHLLPLLPGAGLPLQKLAETKMN